MSDLNALYDLLEQSTLYSGTNKLFSYVKSNPAEAAKVEAYFRSGGARPAVATKFGAFLLDTADAIRGGGGPSGPTGATGSTGPTGATGSTGPAPNLGSALPARLASPTGAPIPVSGKSALMNALASAPAGALIQCASGGTYPGLALSRTTRCTIDFAGSKIVSGDGSQYPLVLSGRNLTIRNAEITDPAGASSAHVYYQGSDCELDHCEIHGNGTASQCSGIFSDSSSARLRVWYSEIHDLGVQANNDHGGYIEGTGHAIIGSLVHGCDKGFGIQIYPNSHDILMAGNTVARNPYKAGYVVGGSSVSNVLIVNNIIAYHVEQAIRTYLSGSGLVRDSCLWNPATVAGDSTDWTMPEQRIQRIDPKLNAAYQPTVPLQLGDPAYTPPLYRDGTPRQAATLGSERVV